MAEPTRVLSISPRNAALDISTNLKSTTLHPPRENTASSTKPSPDLSPKCQYEVAERTGAVSCGALGAMHTLAQRLGLVKEIDEHLKLLKVHLPYHESDHVLNIAYNILAGGVRLEDLELRDAAGD